MTASDDGGFRGLIRVFFKLGDECQHEWSTVHCAGCREADGEVRESRKHHPDRLDEWLHHEQGV